MRFISCHVDNFGPLHDFSYGFNAGLNSLLAPNGFGKSSFAAFLCAMLYGLPRGRQDIAKNPRRRYAPWQGGAFGGSLCFSEDGTSYRVERGFGDAPSGDSFELYELEPLRKSRRFGENLGVELFGLDADSFTRSCYLPQLWTGGSLRTDAISAKLGNLLDDTNDVNNYESAIGRLKAARSGFVPYRDTGGGLAAEAGRELSRLQTELEEEDPLRRRIDEAEQRLLELEADASALELREAELGAELELVAGRAARDMAQKRLAALNAEQESLTRELEKLYRRYPRGLPDEDGLWRMEGLVRLLAQPDAQLRAGLRGIIEQNAQRFSGGIPDAACFERLESLSGELQAIDAELAAIERAAEADREKLDKQEQLFAQGVPDGAELDEIRSRVSKARELALNEGAKGPRPMRPALPLLFAGLAALGVGLTLTLMERVALGHPLLAAGAVCLAVGLLSGPRGNGAWTDYERRLKELSAYLERYPLAPNDPERALFELCSNRDALLELRSRARERQDRSGDLRQRAEKLENELELALAPYFSENEPKDSEWRLARLHSLSRAYAEAKRIAEAENRAADDERRARSADYAALAASYGLPSTPDAEALRGLYEDCAREKRLLSGLERGSRDIRRLRDEQGALLNQRDSGVSYEALRQESRAVTDRLNADRLALAEARRELHRLCLRLDELNEKRDSMARAAVRLEQARANARTLDLAVEYLAQAKRRLAERCLGDIRESFAKNLRQLWAEEADEVLLDEDFRPSLLIQGKLRTPEYFSAGSADLVLLCLRLALVDALFKGNSPPLILDDPFVNLDDRHCALSLELLQGLARDRQILYLSCNSSRV